MDSDQPTKSIVEQAAEQRRMLEMYHEIQQRQREQLFDDPGRPESLMPRSTNFTVPNMPWQVGAQVVWTHGGLTVDEWREYKRKRKAIGEMPVAATPDEPVAPELMEDWQDKMTDLYCETLVPILQRSNDLEKLRMPVASPADVKRWLSPSAVWVIAGFLSEQSAPQLPSVR